MDFSAFAIDTFVSPHRLWFLLVIPLLIALYLWAVMRQNRKGIRYPNTTIMGVVMPVQSQLLRHVAVAFTLLSLVTLVIAWSQPAGLAKVPKERATIVVVVDISMSMEATDVQPSRLAAAKTAAQKFVDSLPSQFNVSLVSLAGNPAVRLPPTKDRGLVKRAIDALTVQESTAIGEAIYTSIGAISMAPKGDDGKPAPGAIVLLSDGDNTAGRSPQQAASEAAKKEIPVYTIAFGTDYGYVDVDGKREKVPPNTELLQQVATIGNGKYWTADSANSLEEVYKGVKSVVGYAEVKAETTGTWAGLGLVFAFLAGAAAVLMGARLA